MSKKISILLSVLLLSSCTISPSEVNTPSTPNASESPSVTESPASTPSSSPADEEPKTNNGIVQLDHAITVKKDGVPLDIPSGATRDIKEKSVKYVFGLKTTDGSNAPPKGDYALTVSYATKDKSPTSDGLTFDDLTLNLLNIRLFEGNEVTPPGSPVAVSYPIQFYGISSTVKEFNISDGKLNVKLIGGFVASANSKTPDFTLDIEIKDAPLM